MKKIVMLDMEKQLINADISLLEEKLKTHLPIEYKKFLLIHNGGHPQKNVYPVIDIEVGSSADIAWFFAYYEGEYENLLIEIARHEGRIPKGFIPIARGSGGDLICLCFEGDEYGKIYFWDHNWEAEEGDKPTFDNMHLVANNFTDFINSLYELDIKVDENENKIWFHIHDKYSLPFSIETKKYGNLITEFFAKAPADVENYIIEEHDYIKTIVLFYEVKPLSKKYYRKISETDQVVDYQE